MIMFVHFENKIDTGVYEWEYKFNAWSLPQVNDLFSFVRGLWAIRHCLRLGPYRP